MSTNHPTEPQPAVHARTKIGPLLERYPFLLEILIAYAPEFSALRSPLKRKTFGRLATLADAARLTGVAAAPLVEELNRHVAARSSGGPAATPAAPDSPADGYRIGELKAMLRELHAGRRPDELAERFRELLRTVSASEIAETEQQLVADGLPETEIKKLCDVHAAVFRGTLDQQTTGLELPAGHPLAVLHQENEALLPALGELRATLAGLGTPTSSETFEARRSDLETGLAEVSALEDHYAYIENQLFPILERYGAEAPPKVMWAVHDDIRTLLKQAIDQVRRGVWDDLGSTLSELIRQAAEMVTKEEQVLFDLCLELFSESDWQRLRAARTGDALAAESAAAASAAATLEPERAGWLPPLPTGHLNLEQLRLMLTHLPFDLTYVDESDIVRFYSEGHRVFPRTPEVIGRKVLNCHPPKSAHIVQRILDEFRQGSKDAAEFWLEHQGRFVHIRYLALHDESKAYRGVLEVVTDATAVRALSGQRRLLDW